jgi:hypothetical protein
MATAAGPSARHGASREGDPNDHGRDAGGWLGT